MPVIHREIGTTGLRRTPGEWSFIQEDIRQLRFPQAADIYREMSVNNPTIASVLYLANTMIRGLEWTVEGDESERAFIQENIDNLETPWRNVIEEILSALVYGFHFTETIYRLDRRTGRIYWRDFAPRSQHSLAWWNFDGDNCTHFVQINPLNGEVLEIPLERGLLFNINKTRKNPEGTSLLRSCWIPYQYIRDLQVIESIGIERSLSGLPWFTAAEGINLWDGSDDSKALMRKIEHISRDIRCGKSNGGATPYGWEFKLLSTDNSRNIDVDKVIKRYSSQLAASFSANLTDMANAVNASAASVQETILNKALQTFVNSIADTFNEYAVKKLLAMNGFRGKAELVPGRIKTPSLNEISLMLRALGSNVNGDKELLNWLRDLAGLPLLDDETFENVYKPQAFTELNNGESHDKTLEQREFEQNGERYNGQ